MESSIAEFLKRQIACELLPTKEIRLHFFNGSSCCCLSFVASFPGSMFELSWTLKGPQKFRKSHWCVPFTATFSKRRKIGASWSERCDGWRWIESAWARGNFGFKGYGFPVSAEQEVRNSYYTNAILMATQSFLVYNRSYLLGLLAMIKCSICSYQCDNWYVSNWKLACHINFFWGGVLLSLLKGPSSVALAWHKAGSSTPFGVTKE